MGSVAAETTGEAQLYERHSQFVYRYCLRMLGTREDAEDAAQTTFFQAVRALRRGVVPSFEQAWLLAIARNECKSRHRAGSRRRRRELAHDPQSLAELAEAPNGGDGRLVGVQQALARLPEMQRRALLLREWQGRSYAEIADELGATRPAVEALLFRARRGLARELGEETTTRRRHALDVASLLAGLKSFVGGSAAVKVAASLAAVATVGTVAAGSPQAPAPAAPVRGVSAVERTVPASTSVARARSVPAAPIGAERQARKSVPRARRKALAPQSEVAAAPRAPAAGAPGPADTTPVTAPAEAPPAPAVPTVPAQQAPQLPSADAPQLPSPEPLPLPPVPQVSVPEVPLVPDVPALPDVPVLPEVPVLPDVPALPDVPILP
jgi:RNA polymerase sigma factor (sigma-70 family)